MIRVLVVDDSATARGLLVKILESDPEIQIVGEAGDGLEAVALTQRFLPDLVTMDIHMPRLDGLEATKEIMITAPTPIVIVTASTRAGEVAKSMDLLALGALDVLVKPVGPAAPGFADDAQHLVEVVKTMSQVKVVRHWRPVPSVSAHSAAPRKERPRRGEPKVQVVAIAASTGGPAALHELLGNLPGDLPASVLVVQHIAHGFTAGLAAWLNLGTELCVKVAEEGEPLAPSTVYFAPEDRHLDVSTRGIVVLSTAPPIGGFRPSATFLFQAAARTFGASAVAVILTGMGDDGVAGLRAVREAGGRVIAQDQASSAVFGMPGAAVAAGVADEVLPADEIAARLAVLVSS
jgi:two-component system chemotaxis response regulator CheB